MSTETHPGLEVTRIDDVTVIRFVRRTILDPDTIELLGERLLSLARSEDGRKLLLDFARVESLPSAMLGKFAALQVKVAGAGGKIVCCNVGDFLRKIFSICHFPEAIPIYDDEAAAIEALKAESPIT